jgi:hypothetical protein
VLSFNCSLSLSFSYPPTLVCVFLSFLFLSLSRSLQRVPGSQVDQSELPSSALNWLFSLIFPQNKLHFQPRLKAFLEEKTGFLTAPGHHLPGHGTGLGIYLYLKEYPFPCFGPHIDCSAITELFLTPIPPLWSWDHSWQLKRKRACQSPVSAGTYRGLHYPPLIIHASFAPEPGLKETD